MAGYELLMYTIVFLYGIVIGSFLNVCIYRIPNHENIVTVRSHCMSCGHELSWYELIPLFSYLAQRGTCRKCKCRLSVQYPLIEGLNGVLYVLIIAVKGLNAESLLCCLLASALIVLSVIDWRTYEIPVGINYFIFILGLIGTGVDYRNWPEHLIGLVCVSGFLYILYYVSKGRAIGGGDVKLMAAAGLLLGWKLIILAFLLGCIIGSVIHVLRMRLTKADHVLAMGPYLSAGILIAALFGEQMIRWYLTSMLG